MDGWKGVLFQTSNSLTDARFRFEHLICRYGIPQPIVLDNGTENMDFTKSLLELRRPEQRRTHVMKTMLFRPSSTSLMCFCTSIRSWIPKVREFVRGWKKCYHPLLSSLYFVIRAIGSLLASQGSRKQHGVGGGSILGVSHTSTTRVKKCCRLSSGINACSRFELK